MALPEACSSASRVKYILSARVNLLRAFVRRMAVSSAAFVSSTGYCFCSLGRQARNASSVGLSSTAAARAAWPRGVRRDSKAGRSIREGGSMRDEGGRADSIHPSYLILHPLGNE